MKRWIAVSLLFLFTAAVAFAGGQTDSGQGASGKVRRLAQLTYTLTQPRGIEAVELLVEGARLEAWGGEGVMTPWPWRRPESGGMPRW